MSTESSDAIEIETGPHPDAAIIWLHGLGADGHDFAPVVPELVRRGERSWRFVFPHAPVRPVTINAGMRMRAWYDIRSIDRGAAEDAEGFRATFAAIKDLIDAQSRQGVPAARIVLAGFSQGGAVSLYTLTRYPETLAGVVALSCYLPMSGSLAAERLQTNDATPVFMGHGVQDPLIPLAMGRESRSILARAGYAVEWHEYPMPHSVCPQEIADIRAFLLRVL